uniref:Uncharacterized protein n=1 Tax=viral metagenome TaxID=1070528 RepID=A0A6M3LMA2_9ZZZZ
MRQVYELVYTVICDDDGLVSHTLKSMKEILPCDEEDEDEDNNND